MNKRGFTLLEVLLFMTISAALAAIAFIGLRPRIRNVQFSTGMRDLQTNITSELSANKLGVNNNKQYSCTLGADGWPAFSSTGTSSGECVTIGRGVGVYQDRIGYYTLVARREPVSGLDCSGLIGALACYRPSAYYNPANPPGDSPYAGLAESDSTYAYRGGIRISRGGDLAFGTFQNPKTGEKYQFFHNGTGARLAMPTRATTCAGHDVVDSVWTCDPDRTRNGLVCFQLSGRKASLRFDLAKPEPKLTFEDPAC